MTKEQLARQITGRQYREELTDAEELLAKKDGLVVVFGASDDLVEFRGAIRDESGASNLRRIYFTEKGLLEDHESYCECNFCGYEAAKAKAKYFTTIWCGEPGYSWTYIVDFPCATFEIEEGGRPYCRGFVFDLKDR